ncbi:hypothetical protein HHI36_005594 [Cryptolaemus montrouzieri]|uniref:Transposase n=1 Tax=Cryptolaemus montrouzieri TaxID=559131 RepID=A0ABD2NUW0_9CUCU
MVKSGADAEIRIGNKSNFEGSAHGQEHQWQQVERKCKSFISTRSKKTAEYTLVGAARIKWFYVGKVAGTDVSEEAIKEYLNADIQDPRGWIINNRRDAIINTDVLDQGCPNLALGP